MSRARKPTGKPQGFQPGNQYAKGAGMRTQTRLITQQMISALNEKDNRGVPKLRKIVDKVIAMALEGNEEMIHMIYDRLEGKTPEALNVSGYIAQDAPTPQDTAASLTAASTEELARHYREMTSPDRGADNAH